jgi:Tol biopolymer transport system component
MYILKKDDLKNPISLGEYMDEGPAISRNNMKIAWTLYGQREIVMADIEYTNGIPKLVNKKTIVNYNDSAAYIRLESQDFRPPLDEELIYTHYWGDEKDAFHHSQTYGYNIKTGKTTDYTFLPDSYNEAEGIFPDGKHILIESDRHQPMELRNQYRLDVYKLKLDGSGEVERLADFSTRYPGKFKSDNPVVDRTGRFIALQFGFMKGAGDGQGIFCLMLKSMRNIKKSKRIQPKKTNSINL